VHQCSIEKAKLNRDRRSYLQNRPSIIDSSWRWRYIVRWAVERYI